MDSKEIIKIIDELQPILDEHNLSGCVVEMPNNLNYLVIGKKEEIEGVNYVSISKH